MLGFKFDDSKPLEILCLGAHCDDIEIGCGGTILELVGNRPVNCTWVVFCSNERRALEAEKCAEHFLRSSRQSNIRIHNFRDGYLPYSGGEVKDEFEKIKQNVNPDIIFTHYGKDKHQDHRLISELTLNTFRNHLILEYEIPKYDGDLGAPNTFVSISEANCQDKVKVVLDSYESQISKNWFTEDLFWSLLRMRGMEINSASKYAEAFYCNKFQISI